MRRFVLAALATVSLAAALGVPSPAAAGAGSPKVAIIVGPVGSLTATYLQLAERAAAEAERRGATVARAYSPNATPANVLAAVEGAGVVIYFGHGYGHPSPYGSLNTARQNGWGLQGPRARGTHGDSLDGELAYYGEDWIVANARPAPGFVMIYSNVCYAPGASEGGFPAATEPTALQRVAHYSRKVFRMGGSAYFATDFDRGAADLVGRILDHPQARFGDLFASDPRYVPSALRAHAHPFSAGQQVWLHRTKYTDGPPNYWYAFAGNPDAVPARSWDPIAPTIELRSEATALGVRPDLELMLSEPVIGLDAGSLALVDAAGQPVTAAIALAADGRSVRVRPAEPIELSARYQLRLGPGVADAAGNPMAPRDWPLATRLDADPTEDALPVLLASGTHEVVRIDALGEVVESRQVAVRSERWVNATRRARLPGRDEPWLELVTADLSGWWIRESSAAHVPGLVAEARLDPGTTVELPAGDYALSGFVDGTRTPAGELRVRSSRVVAVDRRLVADGRLLVRASMGETSLAGYWLEVPWSAAPPDGGVQRITGSESHDGVAELRLGLGTWTLFRFDERGRVTGLREVVGGRTPKLAVERTIHVGAVPFHVVADGDLAGWAVRHDPAHALDVAPAGASAE